MRQFAFHHDSGHGWLQVPERLLKELGIEHFISRFSFKKDDQVWLEEDMDASLFIEAFKSEKGKMPDWYDYFEEGQSKIRKFDAYPAQYDRNFGEVMRKISELKKKAFHPIESSINPNHSFMAREEVRTPVEKLPKSYFVY